ncbi:SOK1 [Candida margitis]|uniref:SOK1 n=1 Tax=Candida margitis TaxID=1775924 RepID=UPI0022263545|nr:SOK1 [Candida margitis]KAI5967478.1 SOK1 [Candida margitis]
MYSEDNQQQQQPQQHQGQQGQQGSQQSQQSSHHHHNRHHHHHHHRSHRHQQQQSPQSQHHGSITSAPTIATPTALSPFTTSSAPTIGHASSIPEEQAQFRQVCFNPVNPSGPIPSAAEAASATTSGNNFHTTAPMMPNSPPSTPFAPEQKKQEPASGSNSQKRLSSSSSDSSKRLRLENGHHATSTPTGDTSNTTHTSKPTTAISTTPASGTAIAKTPKFIRKFRSRSLPIINYNNPNSAFFPHYRKKHNNVFLHANNTSTTAVTEDNTPMSTATTTTTSSSVPPLPPINLQSLKEIDLHEILKNPQLRHDILFDPQLQFRPNLDGERGKRKKSIIDKYWMEIQKECQQFFVPNLDPKTIKISRLPILFTTLRDILLSLLPTKDRQQVSEIMDIDLLVQQLRHGSFDFVEMSKWLGDVFKSHCAPMRDQWVSEMSAKFIDAATYNSVGFLVGGLRMIFQILEAMKLDVANHQIRILRPVLIETAVDFERDYFQTLINHQKININDSLNWFYKKFVKKTTDVDYSDLQVNEATLKPIVISSIIDLLSCRQMATEFPSTLTFDHTRLVLLRADVRQLVCVQLCVVLYKQLVVNARASTQLLSPANITKVQQEVLAIVTDDNGNIKWTKNIQSIALQLVKNVVPKETKELPRNLVEFSHNWLVKHIQPNSEVYGLMEMKIFRELLAEIMVLASSSEDKGAATEPSANNEMKNIAQRIATLVNFHWSVFGSYYLEHIQSQYPKLQLRQQEEKRRMEEAAAAAAKTQDGDTVMSIVDDSTATTNTPSGTQQHQTRTPEHRNGSASTGSATASNGDNNLDNNNNKSAPLSMLS